MTTGASPRRQRLRTQLFVTCEHAGNDVPVEHAPLFEAHRHMLPTHRGWDPGALTLAREMAQRFQAPLYFETTTRLLVDLNRSVRTPDLHSEATRALPLAQRRAILDAYYHPHRQRVDAAIAQELAGAVRLVHIASHSFTPELHGQVRTADIGLLYDPGRPGEVALASAWIEALKSHDPALRVRRNYPYLGKSDGVCQVMRRRYPAERYIGIELEVNQRYVEAGGPAWPAIRKTVLAALDEALQRS
ncbi:MAG: N-formylglutamate amidohydrolase [Pseudomonadota bacterium]|nr:N-formylglutamate amidohydrolase [Pseudomonadota bacterium]